MPSVLLPHIIEQQAKLEKEIAQQRRGRTLEDDVVDWLVKKLKEDDPNIHEAFTRPCEYTCMTYKDYVQNFKDNRYEIPSYIWNYFDFDKVILTEWKEDQVFIVVRIPDWKTENYEFILLEDISKKFDIWKDKLDEYVKGMPTKEDNLFVVRLDN